MIVTVAVTEPLSVAVRITGKGVENAGVADAVAVNIAVESPAGTVTDEATPRC